ncbi:hypothetical protein SUGI_0815660 [Cryptomeria japonica]|nr:hypothetical protein SUGI_0815660 [Cryptomeria japonica]
MGGKDSYANIFKSLKVVEKEGVRDLAPSKHTEEKLSKQTDKGFLAESPALDQQGDKGKVLSNNLEIVANHFDMGNEVGPKACENILHTITMSGTLPELDDNTIEQPRSILSNIGVKSSAKSSKDKPAESLDNISNPKNDNLILGHRSENKNINKGASSNIFMSSPNEENLIQQIKDLVKDNDRRGNVLPSDDSVIIPNVNVVHQANELLNDHVH